MRYPFVAAALAALWPAYASALGLVEYPAGRNKALIVGVGHGLPGIPKDMGYAKHMATHAAYQFAVTELGEHEGTVANIKANLTEMGKTTFMDGTLFFYFSGHGGRGTIYPKDRTMSIKEIREALEAGRAEWGPLARLVLMFDSCHSGSLLDPVRDFLPGLAALSVDENRDRMESELFADEVTREMVAMNRGRSAYWNKLFVFASSLANELSSAGSNGSMFTVALDKAFREISGTRATIADLISKTQKYTSGHHPVARLVPDELRQEPMFP
jgi:hypothetical protein